TVLAADGEAAWPPALGRLWNSRRGATPQTKSAEALAATGAPRVGITARTGGSRWALDDHAKPREPLFGRGHDLGKPPETFAQSWPRPRAATGGFGGSWPRPIKAIGGFGRWRQ